MTTLALVLLVYAGVVFQIGYADGDFHIESHRPSLLERRQQFFPGVWTQLDEVHGVDVKRVTQPGEFDFAVGDALTTDCADAVLSVWVGDCAAIAVVGDSGQFALVHAGWRGALGGVVERSLDMLRSMGASACTSFLLSAIGPCCYEFGSDDLRTLTNRYGAAVASTTSWGSASLLMPVVVAAALGEVGVAVASMSECTRCAPDTFFSHRNGHRGRQVMTVTSMHPRHLAHTAREVVR